MKTFFVKYLQDEKFCLLVIAVAAFLVTLPILIWGIPYGYDMPHHYQCALTYLDAIKSGDFYPSWTLDRNLGYGALELRMYPPISHYVLAIFDLLTGDWHLATWLTYLFWWILGSSGVYLLAREFVKPHAALFAAVLFAVMPYRLSQLYLTFLYSELSAITILPFCFYFLTRILKEHNELQEHFKLSKNDFLSLNVLGLSLSYAALILTHLPMTLIGSFSLGIYFFAQVRWNLKSLQGAVLKTACGLSFGLIATSFFWIKVLQERFLMAKTSVYDEVYVHYQYNFLFTFLQKYNDVSFEVYKTVSVVYDAILFLTLFIILPVAVLGLFFKKRSEIALLRGIWITLIITVFLSTILSLPIWNNLPLLSEVQFPWRFLGVVSIFAPIVAATGFTNLINWFQNEKRRPLALLFLGTIFIGSFFVINQSVRGAVYKKPIELETFVKNVSETEGFTFWWTIWTRKGFNTENKVSAKGREIQVNKWTATEKDFQISAGEAENARIAVFYHPNWKATINDVPVETEPDENGVLQIVLPTGSASVKVHFQETSAVTSAQFISCAVWLFLFIAILQTIKSKFKQVYKNNA